MSGILSTITGALGRLFENLLPSWGDPMPPELPKPSEPPVPEEDEEGESNYETADEGDISASKSGSDNEFKSEENKIIFRRIEDLAPKRLVETRRISDQGLCVNHLAIIPETYPYREDPLATFEDIEDQISEDRIDQTVSRQYNEILDKIDEMERNQHSGWIYEYGKKIFLEISAYQPLQDERCFEAFIKAYLASEEARRQGRRARNLHDVNRLRKFIGASHYGCVKIKCETTEEKLAEAMYRTEGLSIEKENVFKTASECWLVSEDKIEIIADNQENYKTIIIGQIKFIDSCQFQFPSLEKVASNLCSQEKTPEQLAKCFPIMAQSIPQHLLPLLTQKREYLYELNDPERFSRTELPSRKEFNTVLSGLNYCDQGCKKCKHEIKGKKCNGKCKEEDFKETDDLKLKYLDYLHPTHTDYPLCPECRIVKRTELGPHQNNDLIDKLSGVLEFDQSPWLEPYITANTIRRRDAKNAFEKDLWKLMNNAVFGKTMENVRRCTQ
ncbi:398_t:CDS:2 [Dentiscutata erythropus]|uniref:398_t:CDS:1 n=1 Tax=Dentiscutata erythropus TaxID=1348616 RepID=A0A9N9JCE8_9GLOM|nr:398_t:CDS:2 [Dentiscutata erythropus]